LIDFDFSHYSGGHARGSFHCQGTRYRVQPAASNP